MDQEWKKGLEFIEDWVETCPQMDPEEMSFEWFKGVWKTSKIKFTPLFALRAIDTQRNKKQRKLQTDHFMRPAFRFMLYKWVEKGLGIEKQVWIVYGLLVLYKSQVHSPKCSILLPRHSWGSFMGILNSFTALKNKEPEMALYHLKALNAFTFALDDIRTTKDIGVYQSGVPFKEFLSHNGTDVIPDPISSKFDLDSMKKNAHEYLRASSVLMGEEYFRDVNPIHRFVGSMYDICKGFDGELGILKEKMSTTLRNEEEVQVTGVQIKHGDRLIQVGISPPPSPLPVTRDYKAMEGAFLLDESRDDDDFVDTTEKPMKRLREDSKVCSDLKQLFQSFLDGKE